MKVNKLKLCFLKKDVELCVAWLKLLKRYIKSVFSSPVSRENFAFSIFLFNHSQIFDVLLSHLYSILVYKIVRIR